MKHGPKYNDLQKLCNKLKFTSDDLRDIDIERKKKQILTKPLNKKLCKLWKHDKDVNPITNRNIKEEGIIYKEIRKKCFK